jgi:hypothetical protein
MEGGSSGPATAQAGARSRWAAIAWAEAFALVGFFLVAYGFVSSIDCLGPECGGGEASSGGNLLPLLAGLVALGGGAAVAALVSGQPAPLRSAALGFGGLVGGTAFGWAFEGSLRSILPALVLALGAEGVLAIRPPSRDAQTARLLVVGAALAGVVLLTLPAVGVADELVARRRS